MTEVSLRRGALTFGIVASVLAILRVGVWPITTPLPKPIEPKLLEELAAQGWRVRSTVDGQGRQQVSSGRGYVMVNSRTTKLAGVELNLVPVRARASRNIGTESIETAITGQAVKKPTPLSIGGDQFLSITGASRLQEASTCIAGGLASANAKVLSRKLGRPPTSVAERLSTVIGLQPLRNWSCLFVSIRVGNRAGRGSDTAASIDHTWRLVRPVLINQTY
jgi:hypothetical protein